MKYSTDDPNFGMVGDDFHCATCKFLVPNFESVSRTNPPVVGGPGCSNKDFAVYLKSPSPTPLPAPANEYCCNAYRKADKPRAQLIWISSKPLSLT